MFLINEDLVYSKVTCSAPLIYQFLASGVETNDDLSVALTLRLDEMH